MENFSNQISSTAAAAIFAGRRYLGAEIDRTYFELAQKRIAETGGHTYT